MSAGADRGRARHWRVARYLWRRWLRRHQSSIANLAATLGWLG